VSAAENAQTPAPQTVTPSQATSTITLTPSATNANTTPLANLPQVQLALVVNEAAASLPGAAPTISLR
jgi:hypothetical protein